MAYINLSQEERETMLEQQRTLAVNMMNRTMARSFNRYFDPRRDINRECGFPETETITCQEYREMFNRSGYAERVVSAWADEAWKLKPVLYESNIHEPTTDFEKSWNDLPKNLSVEGESYFDGLCNYDIWHFLKEAQIHAGIGHFGCLMLGLNDGRDLRRPVQGFKDDSPKPFVPSDAPKEMELNYLRVFDETSIGVSKWETNKKSPRFGFPILYRFHLYDENLTAPIPTDTNSFEVHWSRVIHLNDGKGTNVLFSPPRQLAVWNNLLSLRKVVPGSAEMYWKGAFMGFALTLMSGYEVGDNAATKENVKEALEKYQAGQQRYLGIPGWDIKELAPQVSDPTPHADVQIDEICVKLSIPKPVFLGSQQGEGPGGENNLTWNARVNGFREGTCVSRYIVPLVDRLIRCGVLRKPQEGSSVKTKWPNDERISSKDQAEVNRKRVQSCQMYVMSGMVKLVPPEIFVVDFLGIDKHEADKWVSKIDRMWLDEKADSTIQIQDTGDNEEDEDEDGENTSNPEEKNRRQNDNYAERGKDPTPATKSAPRPENS